MKVGIYKLSAKFIMARLSILIIGIAAIVALILYGDVNVIYIDMYIVSLIFGTAYGLCYTKNKLNLLYYALILCLIVHFILFKTLPVYNMKYFLFGQAMSAGFVVLFGRQVYRLLKMYRIIKS